jgi:hypothetical protein
VKDGGVTEELKSGSISTSIQASVIDVEQRSESKVIMIMDVDVKLCCCGKRSNVYRRETN